MLKPYFLKTSSLLFLTSICVLAVACASTREGSPNQIAAYTAAMAGKPEEARTLLKSEQNNTLSKFLISCIELSEGNLDVAKLYADEFVKEEPSIPDGRVLVELIENRKVYPEERWLISFAASWKAAGSPRLAFLDQLFKGKCDENCESCKDCEDRKIPETVIGTPDELLAAYQNGLACNGEEFIETCLRYSTSDTPFSIRLISLEMLNPEFLKSTFKAISDELSKRVLARRHDLIQQLSTEYSSYIKFALMSILEQTSTNDHFSAIDVDRLEEAVARPLLAPLPEDIYKDYLNRFISFGESNPYLSASSIARLVDDDLYLFDLKRKILATAETASPEVKRRISIILEKTGKSQLRHGTIVGLLLGTNMLRSAAQLRGDNVMEDRLRVLHTHVTKLFGQSLFITYSSLLWPVRPLMIDSIESAMKDEFAFFQVFADIDLSDELLELTNDY